jgi:hypothetical protein
MSLIEDNMREANKHLANAQAILDSVRKKVEDENAEPETEVYPPDPEALNPATRTHEDN